MIDSFPFEEWTEDIAAFWTFGPGNSTGTYILTVLGIIVMVSALIGWVWLENRKLSAQAALLRAAGGMPAPGGVPPGPGPSAPPLAGPSTDPGD
ncbi:MAG: hypothetical protein ACRDNE_17045 [Gaiellaceae bacterium]